MELGNKKSRCDLNGICFRFVRRFFQNDAGAD